MPVFDDPANFDAYVSGFMWILKMTGASAVLALVLGVLLAAMRVSPVPVLRWFGAVVGQHLPQHPADPDHLLLLLRPVRQAERLAE